MVPAVDPMVIDAFMRLGGGFQGRQLHQQSYEDFSKEEETNVFTYHKNMKSDAIPRISKRHRGDKGTEEPAAEVQEQGGTTPRLLGETEGARGSF